MSAIVVVKLVLGILALGFGANLLVRGASGLAVRLGMTALVVGLTVVAFGTSAPELSVGLTAGAEGRGALVVGNAVGSSIFVLLVVLGGSALLAPLPVKPQVVRVDVPVLAAAALLVLAAGIDRRVDAVEAVLLVGGLAGYTAWTILAARRDALVERRAPGAHVERGDAAWLAGLAIAGALLLATGSRLLVDGAAGFAAALGVSDLVVGLTVVSFATALPELATSAVAAWRGHRDLAIGNAIGSCAFNLLGVIGLSALAGGGILEVPAAAVGFDLPVLLAICLVALPVLYSESRMARWEGAIFVALYAVYFAFVLFGAATHDALPAPVRAAGMWLVPTLLVLLAAPFLRDRLRRGLRESPRA